MHRRLLVLGGNGYVGSHVCKAALNSNRWDKVSSLSRSGKPPSEDLEWTRNVEWCQADLCTANEESTREIFNQATDVISTIGAFASSNARMEVLNGDTNINAIDYCSKSSSVESFGYVSSARVGNTPSFTPLYGYFHGKARAEEHLRENTTLKTKVILRPGFIYGTRAVSNVNLPLWVLGKPMEYAGTVSLIRSLPFLGFELESVISVTDVAEAAVNAISSDEKLIILDAKGMKNYKNPIDK